MTAFAVDGWVFGISRLPGRERPALYEEVDGRVYPLAYFTSEAAADRGDRLLGALWRTTEYEPPLRPPLAAEASTNQEADR